MATWQPDELDAARRLAQSDAIEAGTRDAVRRLVDTAVEQLVAGMLPAQVMGDLLATFTAAQQEDDGCAYCDIEGCKRPDAAAGVEVIAAGAVVMLAQNKIERGG